MSPRVVWFMSLPVVAAFLGNALVERHGEAIPLDFVRFLGRRVEVVFDDVSSLDVGSPVQIRGGTIGRVSRLEYLPAIGRVLVELRLSDRSFRVHPGFEFVVRPGGVVDVDPGDLEAPPLPWARFRGAASPIRFTPGEGRPEPLS